MHASVYVGWNGTIHKLYNFKSLLLASAWTCHTFDFTYWRFKMQVLKIPNFHKLLKTKARFFRDGWEKHCWAWKDSAAKIQNNEKKKDFTFYK